MKAKIILCIILIFIAMILITNYRFKTSTRKEIADILNNSTTLQGILEEDDIGHLPKPVKKWLRNSGAVGSPFISNGKIYQEAKMKLSPKQEKWMAAEAVQYTTIEKPSFIWTVDVKMNPLIKFKGRDKYENGRGHMLIKVNSLINIVNEKGDKLDRGTVQRYLGEIVWFPSMAISPYISWEEINDSSAKATLRYEGIIESGIFHFNKDGEVIKYTAFRYKGNEQESSRYDWVMDISEYGFFEGIKIPTKMSSTWKLDEGDWTWLKLEVTNIKYNLENR